MIKISRRIKSALFAALKSEFNPFGDESEPKTILDFVSDVWGLAQEGETNTYDDIYRHTINNNDWSIEYLFIDKLNLLEHDDQFVKFVEAVVNPKYRRDEDEIIKFVLIINSFFANEGYALSLSDYDEENMPVYKVKLLSDDLILDLPENKIEFHVVTSTSRTDRWSSHQKPEITPSFVLVYNNRWNDYSYQTLFSLFFYKNDKDHYYIGETKITDGKAQETIDAIPKKFTNLSSEYCSLGVDFDFYQKLKDCSEKNFESILYAIKDSAFFSDIYDKFEKNDIFQTSLIRYDDAERQLREAKYKLYGYDLDNLYSFNYLFMPKYAKTQIEVEFDFKNTDDATNRITAFIGKNGTGKTQLITSLPIDISEKKQNLFLPRPPLFSKVIAVSYSIFDDFKIPLKTSSFNYVYCGLFENVKDKREALTQRQLTLRFHRTWKKIKELKRVDRWKKILHNFLDEELINEFILVDENDPFSFDVSVDGFNRIKSQLSSGQNILLFIISEIISNIRLDSLLLFDEPETHLHPNAISQLMNTIYELVIEFQSYCIIATHSPLVIQELFSRNVYVMEKFGNLPSIRRIGVESFGENLTVLSEEVFGNREIHKPYRKIIDRLIEKGLGYAEIIQKLELPETSLSLNLRLYIKSKILNS